MQIFLIYTIRFLYRRAVKLNQAILVIYARVVIGRKDARRRGLKKQQKKSRN